MPTLTESLLTTTWLLSLSSLVQPRKHSQPAFAAPQRITASLSNNNNENDQDNMRSIYVPPYGTIRPSIVILSAQRRRDYAVYDDEYSDVEEDSMGGNYWVNPSRSLDRFPSPAVEVVRRRRRGGGGGGKTEEKRSFNGFRQGGEVTVSGGRAGAPRTETSGDWWETTRMDGDYDEDEYYDDDDDDYEEDQYGEYGMPPPTRSRSSFRTGAPPPPRPIKDFYNKLFWFGFDPSTTRPTDRTMFGGTRGKFNAMELLRDRELRQQRQRTDMMRGEGGSRRSLRGKRAFDPAVQDFGDVREWNARKMGTSPAGGKGVGDDAIVEQIEAESEYNRAMRNLPPGEERIPPVMDADYDPVMLDEEPFYREEGYWDEDLPPPPPPPVGRRRRPSRDRYYDDEEDDDFDFELDDRIRPRPTSRKRNTIERRGKQGDSRGERRRGWDLFPLPESKRRQAEAYDRFIGLGPRPGEEEYDDMDDGYESIVPRSSRRRVGFAYKYDEYDEDDDYDDDDDVIDVRAKSKYSTSSPRRSWEERAMEMDRIPPRSVAAWGPDGRVDRDAQTLAAVDAEREIQKAEKYLEKKEDLVEDAKQEVASLKADASFYEKQLERQQDGRESKIAKRELGYILRDIEDASRILRMAKAERDAAIKMLDRLKSKHWALLSEYEAVRSFEVD